MKVRVIRGGSDEAPQPSRPNPELARLIRVDEQRAAARAKAVVADAEQRARGSVERAEAEAEQIIAAARQEAEKLCARELASAHEQYAHRGRALLEQLRGDLTRLGVNIAEKLLGEQLRVAPESVAQLVGRVLETAGLARQIVIRVHPQDMPLVEARLGELKDASGAERLSVKADDTVGRGGCVLDSPLGEVDGRVETQLQTIATALKGQR